MRRLDTDLFEQVQKETTSKPRVGALFATRYPHGTLPEVASLYKDVAAHLSLP